MKKLRFSVIIQLLLILSLLIISILWDESYKIERIFLILFAVNLIFMIATEKRRPK